MVEIEETEQELMLDEAYVKCFQLLLQTPRNSNCTFYSQSAPENCNFLVCLNVSNYFK